MDYLLTPKNDQSVDRPGAAQQSEEVSMREVRDETPTPLPCPSMEQHIVSLAVIKLIACYEAPDVFLVSEKNLALIQSVSPLKDIIARQRGLNYKQIQARLAMRVVQIR